MPNWVARVLFDIPVQIRKPGFHSAKPAECKSPFTARSMVVGLQLQVLVVRIRCAAEKPRVLVHLGHVDEKAKRASPPAPFSSRSTMAMAAAGCPTECRQRAR